MRPLAIILAWMFRHGLTNLEITGIVLIVALGLPLWASLPAVVVWVVFASALESLYHLWRKRLGYEP